MCSLTRFKVGIIGVGFVGDPLRRWFEQNGHIRGADLFLFDSDRNKGYSEDINLADIVFIALPTNSVKGGRCDTSLISSALSNLKGAKVVVIKSTIPPGTTEAFQSEYPQHKFLFNPEFLTESQAWEDFIHPSRQLVGYTDQSRQYSTAILNLLPSGNFEAPCVMDYWRYEITATEAEMIKYVSNVAGALKVTYCNIIFEICLAMAEELGLDINYENVRKGMTADSRIGSAWSNVLHGEYRGFGGSCFPKDFMAFMINIEEVRDKCKSDNRVELLQKGLEFLRAGWELNKTLLTAQNISIKEASRHNKDINLAGIKKIKY